LRHLCHLHNRELNGNFPKFKGGSIEAVNGKVPTKSGAYRAAIVYRCPKKVTNGRTKTTLKELWNLLGEHEIIQVRGIAREEKKVVFQMATRLCLELE
jgi:hypothetical protein